MVSGLCVVLLLGYAVGFDIRGKTLALEKKQRESMLYVTELTEAMARVNEWWTRFCVWPSAAKGRPAWIFLGGTKERAVGDAPDLKRYELVADGAWHQITVDLRELRKQYPDITMLQSFGFYTHLNAKETDEFWIDDFGIR